MGRGDRVTDHVLGLPVTNTGVNIADLAPRLRTRLEALFADPRITSTAGVPKIAIVSGARTEAAQRRLYTRYRAGKAVLAADPNRRFGPVGSDGLGIWRGSWHMTQNSELGGGYAWAVDFRILGGIIEEKVNEIATEYGVRPTLIHRGEWWHHQCRAAVELFPAPALTGDEPPLDEPPEPVDLAGILAAILGYGEHVAANPVRRGHRGDHVRTLQARLGALGFDAGPLDGVAGKNTLRAVRSFQRSRGLTQDGICGRRTWNEMWRPDTDETLYQ